MNTSQASRYHTKNRIVAVDIVRLTAAMAVLFEHLPVPPESIYSLIARFPVGIFSSFSNIFFVLAGYFACRNITWKKAFDNAWWSFAPFILWNAICFLTRYLCGTLPEHYTWYSLIGCTQFIIPELSLNVHGSAMILQPLNGPLWFMRDLVFLFLLSPILSRSARYLFPILLILSFVPDLRLYFSHDCGISTALSPYCLSFFTAGCFLRTLSKERQMKVLSFYNTWLIIIVCTVNALLAWHRQDGPTELWHSMLSLWVFYQVARWIEVHIPKSRDFALKYAPVTFLTFAMHMIIYLALPSMGAWVTMLYPFATFAFCSLVFFTMKKHARGLLHLVAHYKLRPDDMQPRREANAS